MTQTQRPPTLIPSIIAPALQSSVSATPTFSERLWQRFATLRGRFTLLLIIIVAVTCLTALAVALSSNRAYGDLNTIGTQSIPSISAAQTMIPYLEDIDAHAADYMANTQTSTTQCINGLTGQTLSLASTAHDCASKIIDTDLQTLNHELFLAGQNASYPGSHTSLEQTQAGLETYVADINLMRYEFGQITTPGNPNDPHLQQAYQASQAAHKILLQQLAGRVVNEPNLPSCSLDGQTLSPRAWPNAGIEENMLCLSALGKPRLDNAYQDTVNFFGISLGIVFGLSIYSCIFLVWAAWSMTAITRKLFNPALLLALIVALVSTSAVLADFDAIYGHNGYFSRIANAYNNVYTAGSLEQAGAQVQANQARWLEALSFHDANANQWAQNAQRKNQQVTSLLHTLNTNTPGSPLLAKIQQDWNTYNMKAGQVSQTVSTTPSTSSINQAEALHSDEASAAFQTFTHDIQQFSTLNTSSYTGILQEARSNMELLTTLWAIIFPVLGVIGAWGISRRLKEF